MLPLSFIFVQLIEAPVDYSPIDIGFQGRLDADGSPILPKPDKYIIDDLLCQAGIFEVFTGCKKKELIMLFVVVFKSLHVFCLYGPPDFCFVRAHFS
jgi:hypothetical protein